MNVSRTDPAEIHATHESCEHCGWCECQCECDNNDEGESDDREDLRID